MNLKVLFILTLVLALSLAAPAKKDSDNKDGSTVKVNRRYSLRKTSPRRDAAVKPGTGGLAPEGIAASANSPDSPKSGTVKKKVGTKPFGEPDSKLQTSEPPVFPPKSVEPAPTKAPKVPPTLPPTTRAPLPPPEEVAPQQQQAPAPTQAPPPPPPPNVNTTGTATSSGNEDDSSSEEDDEDADEDADDEDNSDADDYDDDYDGDDGRQLFPLHKPTTKGTVQPEEKEAETDTSTENVKPYKVKAFVTENGQILVPIETFQKYFDFPPHAVVPEPQEIDLYRSFGPPSGYIVSSRQESLGNTGSSEEESSESSSNTAANKDEEKDEEAESEESAPAAAPAPLPPPTPTKKPNKKLNYNNKQKIQAQQQAEQKAQQAQQIVEQAEVNSEEAGEDEEKPVRGGDSESSVSIETEEKGTSVESVEQQPQPQQQIKKPVRTQPEKNQPRPPGTGQGRPPLAVIPANAATNEDDEEEAGRAGFGFFDLHSPIFEPYYDDNDYEFEMRPDYFL